ncbi:MAG: GNAT family N-acetyltransferase [Alphaproteobacteria bacterium]|nr:GNAT family N-acetyltransferase [Alphaproteobacteria bacterium]
MTVTLEVGTVATLSEVPAAAWDALAGPDNPFVEHAFLRWLEDAGCVGAEAGWQPAHVVVWQTSAGARTLVAAMPLYVKDNSYGEYIFDWGWANAAQRAGIRYYPKVVGAVPFTPATGPRLLVHPDADADALRPVLARAAREVADAVGASSVHVLFAEAEEVDALVPCGLAPRLSYQYHWHDRGFGDFDGYLAAMTARRRKEVRRERKQAAEAGLTLAVEGLADLDGDDLAALHGCYLSTLQDRWSQPYLTPAWFEGLAARVGHRGVVATARRDGRLVAASLAFTKGRHLYGRYWGALEPVRALHFELSYYQLIDWALAHGIVRFEAGAQGQHKLARGFLPELTWSAHWVRHPGLDRAVRSFLDEEAAHVRALVAAELAQGPFRDGGEAGA